MEKFELLVEAFMRLGHSREEAARRAWSKCMKDSAKKG
jgi:hypothetical protein